MKYLSVCDGIGAAHVAWKPLGWQCVGASEIERFPIAVVNHQHPGIPELGDMTKYHEWNIERPDLVCGGTPCQSFSVAGLRKGMADPRGNLALTFLALVDHFRPKWVVWENVPGVLSSGQGRDFGAFLGGLGQLGYGFAYRVLDAQYFGLAQRRKRVFVVGCLGDWRGAAAVLFERESLFGYPAPSRGKGQGVTGTLAARTGGGGGPRGDFQYDGGLVETVGSLCSHGDGSDGQDAYSGRILPVTLAHGQANAEIVSDGSPSLTCNHEAPIVFDPQQITSATNRSNPQPGAACDTLHRQEPPILVRMREGKEGGGKGPLVSKDQSLTLATGNDQVLAYTIHGTDKTARVASETDLAGCIRTKAPGSIENSSTTVVASLAMRTREGVVSAELGEPGIANALRGSDGGRAGEGAGAVLNGMQVRRLTPRECERLQGFPDDYTLVPWRGNMSADGPRYKALGNSWAVPVVRWIGERIELVQSVM